MKKGDKLDNITIETMAAEGKCIAKHDGLVIFIQGGAPGDVVEIELTKIKSSFLEGRVTQIRNLSPHRAQPFCTHFGLCGGCSWQHINYNTQLQYKQQQVIDNLERLGGLQLPVVSPIVASAKTDHYRNKLDYTFTANRWLTKEELAKAMEESRYEVGLGYHLPGAFDRVFDVAECHLQSDPSDALRLLVKKVAVENNIPFFDLRRQTGFLRTLTIRSSNTNEVMVILQVTSDNMGWTVLILLSIIDHFPSVTSLYYIINN
ncbi:MAG: class I SAM-dependent RNA methyltransferase [Cyclobacteriaceae bacterium]